MSEQVPPSAELQRAASGLARLAESALGGATAPALPDFEVVHAAQWVPGALGGELRARGHLDAITLADLIGIDRQLARVEANTRQFVRGLPANNVLLWGARGTGKSSLVHALLNAYGPEGLRLVEIPRNAISGLPAVLDALATAPQRFILFCDDLSFEADDPAYKVLKSVLDGSMFAATDNVLIYATSNRRHLMPESLAENLEARHDARGEVHPGESTEEKVSLSDRFGIWVSFQAFPQGQYLDVAEHWVKTLARQHGVAVAWDDGARSDALRWALTRGARSGRVANQFARHHVGQAGLAAASASSAPTRS